MTTAHHKSKKPVQGLMSHAVKMAKKAGGTGLNVLNQIVPKAAAKLGVAPQAPISVQAAQQKFSIPQYDNPQQVLREHLPKVSHQILGKHYQQVNRVAQFFSPEFNDKLADYFYHQLTELASQLSSTEDVLQQSGVTELSELGLDIQRSQRVSLALLEQNKLIALAQGSLSGATGVFGAAVDVPVVMALALRTIYQTGRAYGFELSTATEQDVVNYIFKDIELGLMAEKQSLLMALRSFKLVSNQRNLTDLQQLIGSGNDSTFLKSWLNDADGQVKWPWLQHVSAPKIIAKLTPVASAGLSALYSWKLIDDAGHKAQVVFAGARHYLLEHPNSTCEPLQAYLQQQDLIGQAIFPDTATKATQPSSHPHSQAAYVNPEIRKVEVLAKQTQPAVTELEQQQQQDLAVERGLEQLAEAHVNPHDDVPAQQPALSAHENVVVLDDELTQLNDNALNQPAHIHEVQTPKRS